LDHNINVSNLLTRCVFS